MLGITTRRVIVQTRPYYRQRCLATLAQEVLRDETFHIPVVSFSKFRKAKSSAEKEQTANEVVTAFKEVGFVYLKDHGISPEVIDNAFKQSAEFFKLPMEEKMKIPWDDPRANRGYVARGRERVTQETDPVKIAKMRASAPDAKESMEIGRDWDATWKNKWPQDSLVPKFRPTFLDFFQTCHELHVDVMRSIATGLELEENFFDDKIHEQYHNLRLLNYPSIRTELLRAEGQARAGAHSDYGTLTFVFQDSVGGLEVQNPHTKQYHPATPIPGTIVVNVGDLLARWSNDVFRSTLHRVVSPSKSLLPPDAEMTPSRQSIAFFCNPNGGANISCLPHCLGTTGAKYPAVTTQDYIVSRLSETYS
ncbi:hypothetical protein M408DRAFT_330697 [Serendipita vermifera MAFF 305830]|uniref:Fe2OG dioxygenase domain-containing protein n=1 Tax=Serendipita vermifera MAFF 305830 TaxID=933852 RepID=A0A0C3B2D1_SERVB|nr:hypothetical protein M408DRAFT_330697 [Serendipita vermifera MAFF 305830]